MPPSPAQPEGPPPIMGHPLILRAGQAYRITATRRAEGRAPARPSIEFSALVQLASDRAAREGGRVVVDVVGVRVGAEVGAGRAGVRCGHAALLDVARARRR